MKVGTDAMILGTWTSVENINSILDIGTGSTDLVVASGSRCWMCTFPLGGHSFTEAIVEAFAPTVAEVDEAIEIIQDAPAAPKPAR